MSHEKGRPEGAPSLAGETVASVAHPADDYRKRLAEQVARWQARKAAERAVRATLAARRTHGLRRRHQAKLRRSGGGHRG